VIVSVNFDEKVWKLMERIPRGKVTTYGQIARKLNTKAYRAVGNACRKNPYAPRVPCHRVVRSDGTIGGFGGKTSGKSVIAKAQLLHKENVEVRNGRVVDFERVLFKF
jgi:methylated-DNA-[protein]-cysteine S-methyltransferase